LGNEEDAAAVEAIVRKHGSNFVKQDAASQLTLWDQDYPRLTLLPTERKVPLKTWGEIKAYYESAFPDFAAKRWDIVDLTVDLITDDVAFVLVLVDAQALSAVDATPAGFLSDEGLWPGRITYTLHKTSDGWKIIHIEDSTVDLFRAEQVWESHEHLAKQAFEILQPILNPPASS
jgi:ketosteroid isomerase-like protein